MDLPGASHDDRLLHQAVEPDSLLTLGTRTPGGEVPPDPLMQGSSTRPRAAGSFLPVDTTGRPYQLRLGARLVW